MPHELQTFVPAEIKLSKDSEGSTPEMSILGYTGKEVDLSDYGVDAPVVYLTDGIKGNTKFPYLLNHDPNRVLGHVTSHSTANGKVTATATHSYPSQESKEVALAIRNGVPYQSSMGLKIDLDSVVYHAEGTVKANGRVFNAPIYTVGMSKMTELSATLFGRDDDTNITKLSKDTLMTIKNGAPKAAPDTSDTPPVAPVAENTAPVAPVAPVVVQNSVTDPGPSQEDLFNQRISNAMEWAATYPDNKELVVEAIRNGWDSDRLEREVKFHKLENSYQSVPSHFTGDSKVDNSFTARFALSLGLSPEAVEAKVGKAATDHALSQGTMGLKESLMLCANSNGGRFTGHSDSHQLGKFVKRLVQNNAFSTINFPNLMHQVAQWKLEAAWMLDAPFAPEIAMALSNKDFRKTAHIRPGGGEMWNGLNKEGKIDHGSFGTESTYETKLSTVAQIVTFKREDVINDDIGWIQTLLDLMIEGALMVPDYQLVNLIYNATSAGMLTSGVNSFTLPFNATNLETLYNAVKRRSVPKGDKIVKARQNTKFELVFASDLEKEVWEVIRQAEFVQGTSTDVIGKSNYWKDKFELRMFDQLDNTTYHKDAKEKAWGLVPTNTRVAPFAITYLNGMQRPTTETVDLPADELGFGVRGWWDVNLDYRPVEDNKLQATAWSFPANS